MFGLGKNKESSEFFVTSDEEFEKALKKARDNGVIRVGAGSYCLYGTTKASKITLIGESTDSVIFEDIAVVGASDVTLKNIHIKPDNDWILLTAYVTNAYTFQNCIFDSIGGYRFTAQAYNGYAENDLVFENCKFIQPVSKSNEAAVVIQSYEEEGFNIKFIGCIFENIKRSHVISISSDSCTHLGIIFDACTFTNNNCCILVDAKTEYEPDVEIKDCTFTSNEQAFLGRGNTKFIITNCTIKDKGDSVQEGDSTFELTNCTLSNSFTVQKTGSVVIDGKPVPTKQEAEQVALAEKLANIDYANLAAYSLQELLAAEEMYHDSRIQYQIFAVYYQGLNGTEKDESKAVEWLTKSAEQNNAMAQRTLGELYYTASCVQKNFAKAVEWLSKAAEQGDSDAQCDLALCYKNGEGVPKDTARARELAEKAVSQNNARAQSIIDKLNAEQKAAEEEAARKAAEEEAARKAEEERAQKAAQEKASPAPQAVCAQCGAALKAGAKFCMGCGAPVPQTHNCPNCGAELKAGAKFCPECGAKQDEAPSAQPAPHTGGASDIDFSIIEKFNKESLNTYDVATIQKAEEATHDPRLQTWLGVAYRNGAGGVEANIEEAVRWYKKASEQGYPIAQFELGCCYSRGDGVPQSDAQAITLLKPLAEKEDFEYSINATMVIAFSYYNGESDVPQDYTEAVHWFTRAAEKGNADTQFQLGVCYFEGTGVTQNYEEAAKWLQKSAEQGNPYAQYEIGKCYANGLGVQQNDVEAAKWYQKAAEQGDAHAQYSLALCYYNGKGVPENHEEAVKWYQKAAEQGHAGAQFILGLCYAEGSGIDQNNEEAAKWYRKAAEQGLAMAQYQLGVCYYYGEGVTQNYEEAAKWLQKSAEQGNPYAQYEIGKCYANGLGVQQNDVEAAKWYQKAAEAGEAKAQFSLGRQYYNGYGVPQSYEEAMKWWLKSAEQNNPDAMYYIAECYEDGIGVPQNHEEAEKWYHRAAENGSIGASLQLSASKEKAPSEITVGQGGMYTDLQAAVEAAPSGATIKIINGDSYPAPVVVHKDLTFLGHSGRPVIHGFVFLDAAVTITRNIRMSITTSSCIAQDSNIRFNGVSFMNSTAEISLSEIPDAYNASYPVRKGMGQVTFLGCVFKNNNIGAGESLIAWYGPKAVKIAELKFDLCTFSENKNGALIRTNCDTTFNRCRFKKRDGEKELAIFATGQANVTIQDSHFIENYSCIVACENARVLVEKSLLMRSTLPIGQADNAVITLRNSVMSHYQSLMFKNQNNIVLDSVRAVPMIFTMSGMNYSYGNDNVVVTVGSLVNTSNYISGKLKMKGYLAAMVDSDIKHATNYYALGEQEIKGEIKPKESVRIEAKFMFPGTLNDLPEGDYAFIIDIEEQCAPDTWKIAVRNNSNNIHISAPQQTYSYAPQEDYSYSEQSYSSGPSALSKIGSGAGKLLGGLVKANLKAWSAVGKIVMIGGALMMAGSSSSGGGSSSSGGGSSNIYWWRCPVCGTTVKQSSVPSPWTCGNGRAHDWSKLGRVGNNNFHCSRCGTTIYTDSSPSPWGCTTDGKAHNWNRL